MAMAGRTTYPTRRVALLAAALALAGCGSHDAGQPQALSRDGAVGDGAHVGDGAAPETVTAEAGPAPTQAALDRLTVRLEHTATMDGAIAATPGADARTFYVAQRRGLVRLVRDGRVEPLPMLDLTREVSVVQEDGLIGIARAADGRHLYLTFVDPAKVVHLLEYALDDAGRTVDASRRELLAVPDDSHAHHGGDVQVGPDGLLYVSLGDGHFPGGDPAGLAQSPASLRGKILRIDPRPSGGRPYTIPAGNPFAGRAGARPEIWAYGLRNPWRIGFDRPTGDLWIGDVGEYRMEEVDVLRAGRGGANLGWNRLEGVLPHTGAAPAGAVAPVLTYRHGRGPRTSIRCAVIGGRVYRGGGLAGLRGGYVFGDVCDNSVRVLARGPGGRLAQRRLGALPGLVSFVQGRDGEVYGVSMNTGLWRLAPPV